MTGKFECRQHHLLGWTWQTVGVFVLFHLTLSKWYPWVWWALVLFFFFFLSSDQVEVTWRILKEIVVWLSFAMFMPSLVPSFKYDFRAPSSSVLYCYSIPKMTCISWSSSAGFCLVECLTLTLCLWGFLLWNLPEKGKAHCSEASFCHLKCFLTGTKCLISLILLLSGCVVLAVICLVIFHGVI